MSNGFYVGKRLSYDRQLCTVRYIGEIRGTKGTWLGVEWDDPTRGKHVGEHQGVRYFDCLYPSSTPASFIRANRKSDAPRTFVQALRSKYAPEPEDYEESNVRLSFHNKPGDNAKAMSYQYRPNQPIRFSGKVAEEVGFDKIRKQLSQLSELRIIILDGLCMWRPEVRSLDEVGKKPREAGESTWLKGTDIKEVSPKIVELDLSRNLFEEWREVADICTQLESLQNLRVDGNRFRDTSLTANEREQCRTIFANVNTLKLEETLLSWEDLSRITHLFPVLLTFSASSNMYTSLTAHMLNPSIVDLTLEDNSITSLSSLEPLTKLTQLRRLILKSNKISNFTSANPSSLVFSSSLREVDLSFNEISNWQSIEQLSQVFPGLKSLRVTHNPLYETLQAPDGRLLTPDDGYMITLARLGDLQTLNHSPITEKERLNAESYYLSLIVREVQFAPESLREQILASHPRYKWLCDEYGEPDIQRTTHAVNPNSLAARLICVRFYHGPNRSSIYEVEIPGSCTVYTVLGLVGKHFGLNPMKCRLTWETGDWMLKRKAEIEPTSSAMDLDDSDVEIEMEKVMREVEIVPGTRALATWVDVSEVTIRVEEK